MPHRFLLRFFFGTPASDDEDLETQISMQIYHHSVLVNRNRILAPEVNVRDTLDQVYT